MSSSPTALACLVRAVVESLGATPSSKETAMSPASTDASSPSTAAGTCLCGAVSFTARLPSHWIAHCHCTRCQRAHGAAFVTWVSVASGGVSIEDPGAALRWYAAPAGGERGFCGRCGSPLFFRSARWPGELHIARASFTGALDREPQVHAYYDTHVPWVTVADELPKKPDPRS